MKLTKEQKVKIHAILLDHRSKMLVESCRAVANKDTNREAFYDQKRAEVEQLIPIFAKAAVIVEEEEERENDD